MSIEHFRNWEESVEVTASKAEFLQNIWLDCKKNTVRQDQKVYSAGGM